jgi:tRNA pseudouridine55 synthase
VLALLKPVGPTSHDVVARARRWLPGARLGHLGTLDPAAAGLLLLAVGGATRAARFLDPPETVKRYRAWAVFGLQTDGDDFDGRVLARRGAGDLDAARLEAALAARVGVHPQVPPARSAVRVGGRHAYRLSRQGERPELAAREVVVEEARLVTARRPAGARDLLEALLEVAVRRGGYVRALVRDLGQDVGTGACVRVLVRGAIGTVRADEALSLEEAEALADDGALAARLWPVDRLLAHWPALAEPPDRDGRRVGRGRAAPAGAEGFVRLRAGPDAAAWALAEARDGRWRQVVRLTAPERSGAEW